MQQFFTRRLFVAQNVSGVAPPIIRSIQLHLQSLVLYTLQVEGCSVVGRGRASISNTNNDTAFNLQRIQNQRLQVQLYAPDDRRYDARNMLSHK
jgi:hypothetical protein